MSFPDSAKAAEFLDEVALPALEEVAAELKSKGVEATTQRVEDNGSSYVELAADLGTDHPFHYQIWPREAPVPVYRPRARRVATTSTRRSRCTCVRAVRVTT